jgi:hypothetical protein
MPKFDTDEEWIAWRDARLAKLKTMTHLTADGYPIVEGGWYWDNNLEPVQITEVAQSFYAEYPLGGHSTTQVWHSHTRGQSDSLLERHDIGRLVKYWNGKLAKPEPVEPPMDFWPLPPIT